jgi:hypothetical protein
MVFHYLVLCVNAEAAADLAALLDLLLRKILAAEEATFLEVASSL